MIRIRANRRSLVHAGVALGMALASCHHTPAIGSQPIPLPDRAPWQRILADSAFSIAMDTSHLQRGPENDWIVWYITTHTRPQGPDSMRFDRGRISLLVRFDPPASRSRSEDLARGASRPVFHQQWQLSGANAVQWRTPQPGTTDAEMLRATCALLTTRKGAT